MDPRQAAAIATQAADEILAELSKIGDLTARATALRTLTVRLGGLAPVEVEAWASAGGQALRDGLALAISRNMARAEGAPAMSGWEDALNIGLSTVSAVGGAVGGRTGSAITTGIGAAQAAIGAVQGIVGAVQQGGNAAAQGRAAAQLLQAAQAQAQANAIIAAQAAAQRQPAPAPAPRPAPAPKPTQKTAPRPMQRQDSAPAPAPAPAAVVTEPTTGMSPTAKTAAIVGGSAVGLGLIALLLRKVIF